MVQKRVQKQVQAKSNVSAAMDDKAMPQYMFKNQRGTGYFFRRGVPADVQPTIGKLEFKVTLGGDFRSASLRCRELAAETDKQIKAARAGTSTSQSSASAESERVIAQSLPPLAAITSVTPDFIARLEVADHGGPLRQICNRAFAGRSVTN